MAGFVPLPNRVFQGLPELPDRYVVKRYPHPSLWGTPGVKEALIVSKDATYLLVPSDDGFTRVLMEAKWQEGAGSVDEKLPYVWLSFLESVIPNWILVLDGNYWNRNARAKAAISWAKAQVAPPDRTWNVVNRRGFAEFAKECWGGR
jgi:hypothetical protein